MRPRLSPTSVTPKACHENYSTQDTGQHTRTVATLLDDDPKDCSRQRNDGSPMPIVGVCFRWKFYPRLGVGIT